MKAKLACVPSSRMAILSCLFAYCAATPVAHATTDTVGGTSSSNVLSGAAKGNVYHLLQNVNLIQFESYLSFSGTETLNFYVFSNSTEFGTYTQIQSTSYEATGTGTNAFYSSGPLNTPLAAGLYYLLAVSWSGSANKYYFNVGDTQSTSFGAYVHGYATGTHPLGGTITTTVNDQAIYYQRVTTVPEPSTLSILFLSVLILSRRKAVRSAHR